VEDGAAEFPLPESNSLPFPVRIDGLTLSNEGQAALTPK
jgi:hypothetical protein